MKLTRVAFAFAVLGSVTFACSSDDSDDDAAAGKAGTAGKSGSAGKAGAAGKSGAAGKGGAAGKAGTTGVSGEGAASGAGGEGATAGEGGAGGRAGSGGTSAGTSSAGTMGAAGDSGDVYGEPNPVPVGGFWNCVDPSSGGASGGGGAGSADTCSCEFAVAIDNNAERTCTGSSPCCILSRALTTGVYSCDCSDKNEGQCKAAFESMKTDVGYAHIVSSCPTYP